MNMTEYEIIDSYKRALSPKDQIKILAELNATDKSNIESVLHASGYAKIYSGGKDMMLEKHTIERLIACGWNLTRIAKKYHSNSTQMRKVLKNIGIKDFKQEEKSAITPKKTTKSKNEVAVDDLIEPLQDALDKGDVTSLPKIPKESEFVKPDIMPTMSNVEVTDDINELIGKALSMGGNIPVIPKLAQGVEDEDAVNHPSHYCQGQYECIDVMLETQGIEAVKSFCICNAFKYLFRHNEKNGAEDIKKAQWYINKYIELSERKN